MIKTQNRFNDQKIWCYFSSTAFIDKTKHPNLDDMKIFTRMRLTCFNDLVAAVALARPIEDVIIEEFLAAKRSYHKKNNENILSCILAETYGFLLYQEQVIEIAHQIGNFTHEEAGNLRVALAKKQRNKILDFKKRFLHNAVKNHVSREKSEEIFEMLEKLTPFAFKKSCAAEMAETYYRIACEEV